MSRGRREKERNMNRDMIVQKHRYRKIDRVRERERVKEAIPFLIRLNIRRHTSTIKQINGKPGEVLHLDLIRAHN